eukprot:898000_1
MHRFQSSGAQDISMCIYWQSSLRYGGSIHCNVGDKCTILCLWYIGSGVVAMILCFICCVIWKLLRRSSMIRQANPSAHDHMEFEDVHKEELSFHKEEAKVPVMNAREVQQNVTTNLTAICGDDRDAYEPNERQMRKKLNDAEIVQSVENWLKMDVGLIAYYTNSLRIEI